ncbi:MAG: histidine--tRNA ligase [Candidatus Eisenbacteria bacterium]|nr:histidine--tRNA ligase [Candidatus Eisenbacteria bacterium]
MAPKHQAPRGTRDLLPGEIERWQWAEDRARGVLERYGYREIRTPLFEDYELFARTSGESSDVVQKEMYRFKDLGGRDLALRPEGTASVCRAYLEHGLGGRGRIHRLWYLGPMFRYGRPQKGRFRQFWQIGAEILGTGAPGADVEMIALFVDLFAAWGFGELAVLVNSVGTPDSRRAYGDALREWFGPVRPWLSPDSQRRLETNPLRVLDSKDARDMLIWSVGPGAWLADEEEDAFKLAVTRTYSKPKPHLLDFLDSNSSAHWDAVLAGLSALGIATEIDHGLVRGLDYYTRTAFEVHDRSLGAQSALGGGGRYDGLVETLGGPPTPGVGFSIGLDRVLLALEQRGTPLPAGPAAVFVAAMEGTRAEAAALVRRLRRVLAADWDMEERGFGAQMKAAGKSGARLLLIVGEEEWERGDVVLKDVGDGSQRPVPVATLEDVLLEALGTRPTETRAR